VTDARRARPTRLSRTTLLLAVSLFVAVASSSCSSGHKAVPRYSGPAYGVGTGSVSGLGTVLVDGQGFTLYMYEPDAQSGRSKCYGPCAVEWSPLTLPSGLTRPVAGPGITASKLSTSKRTDGSVQVTYNGWPLYTWAQDMAPGQATGEGLDNLGGLWYVLNPSGTPIEKRTSGSV
jgi:predicted lipoprotein with Yx(FWY)xxD motif